MLGTLVCVCSCTRTHMHLFIGMGWAMGWKGFTQLSVDDDLELLLRPGPEVGHGPALWPIISGWTSQGRSPSWCCQSQVLPVCNQAALFSSSDLIPTSFSLKNGESCFAAEGCGARGWWFGGQWSGLR